MRRNEAGFTLMELLVTVVIVGVLAAIALPALTGQREKAYRSVMANDLHALMTFQAAWNAENGGFTADMIELEAQGLRLSDEVTAHVRVVAASYVGCTKHNRASHWLVYSSATEQIVESQVDCAL